MSRIRTFVTIMLPSMIAGGFLFGSALGEAASGDPELAFWPDPTPVVVAQADPPKARPTPPAPPVPPKNAKPPKPPTPPGISINIDHGKLQLTGVREMVKAQLASAKAAIQSNGSIPPDVRAKILARMDKVGAAVDKRLANLKLTDLDQLDDEMEKMGEDLEAALEGLDEDMEKLGEKLGKDININLGKFHFGNDDDVDDIDIPSPPDVGDSDDSDMREAISDLKDLALKPAQRDKIVKLRADSDKAVAASRKTIDELSAKLHTALGNPNVSDADISKLVDQISSQEATMRKARILAWAAARRELDVAQRKKVEDAAAKAKPTR